MKSSIKVFLVTIAVLILFPIVWAEDEVIPVPQGAEKTKEQKRMIMGMPRNITYYTSSQDTANIREFYLKTLPGLGWKLRDLVNELSKVNVMGFNMDSRPLGNNLIFEKDSQALTIIFIPAGRNPDKKTRFTVSVGEFKVPEGMFKDPGKFMKDPGNLTPSLIAQPKLDIAPLYPKASLMSLTEGENSQQAAYFTSDDMQTVATFYRNNMYLKGWLLQEEKPLRKMDPGDKSQYDLQKVCPTCPKTMNVKLEPPDVYLQELKFNNALGETCVIGLSQVSAGKKIGPFAQLTSITVNYEGKKK